MSPEIISIIVLGVMFVVATVLPINIGILAFIGAFIVGTVVLGLDEEALFAGFPASLFVTIVGVTYLFSVAKLNGTIDLLVQSGVRLVGGRTSLVPWVLFVVAAVLTAFGTFTPAAVALLVPVGMNFAARHGVSPLMIGMMVISGAHAGAFSPIAVSGVLVMGMVAQTSLAVSSSVLFFASFAFNLVLSLVTYGLLHWRRPKLVAHAAGPETIVDESTAIESSSDERAPITWQQRATLLALLGLVIGALMLHLPIGFLALAAGALLGLFNMRDQSKAIEGISWSTILLVAGMVTYVGILEQAGTIEMVSQGAVSLGAPLLVTLMLCFTVAITSAFASSTAIITAVIPMAVPLLLSSSLPVAGVIAAMSISTTIVDVSPFSTNGALVLANVHGVDRTRFYRQLIAYTGGIIAVGPLAAWAALVLLGIGV